MSRYTVFGGRGFIGSEITRMLTQQGHTIWVPERGDDSIFDVDLGIVIYCAGNGDCKNTPFAVFEANCHLLAQLLEKATFSRLVYISSTRVYMNSETSHEQDDVLVCVDDGRRLFNLTKLVGEELCLKSGREITIVRPSNVYGVALNSPLFLPAITRNAINHGKVDMYIAPDYAKDYVSVSDVASATIRLATLPEAVGQIVNVAAGYNVTAQQIAEVLQTYTQCEIVWHQGNFPREKFPVTDISKICHLFPGFTPKNVLNDIQTMIYDFKCELDFSE